MNQFISVIFKHNLCGKYSASKIELNFTEDEITKSELLNKKYKLVDKYCCRCLTKNKRAIKLTEDMITYHPRKFCFSKNETYELLIRNNRTLM